jgi:hypothetical protein
VIYRLRELSEVVNGDAFKEVEKNQERNTQVFLFLSAFNFCG